MDESDVRERHEDKPPAYQLGYLSEAVRQYLEGYRTKDQLREAWEDIGGPNIWCPHFPRHPTPEACYGK